MFKSIITRYHGPTDHKGSRISASAEGVPRLYMSYDYGLNAADNHAAAAAALANRYGWLRDGMRLTGGGLPNGRGYAFVFTAANAADTTDALTDLVSVKDLFQNGLRGGDVMGVISTAMDKAENTLRKGGH